jgi:cytochrome c6
MAKQLVAILFLVLTLCLGLMNQPVSAADLAAGARVFSANCAACHANGLNVVNATKTLKKTDLEQYGMASLAAIQTQVMKGKNAMPAFLGRLSDQDIENVAAYVLDQAEQGW